MKKNRPIRKLLAANRSEIAIRIFRAANELGLRTVAIYSQEDRLALHRFKADEAYQVGVGKGPVEAYLDIPGIIAVAKEHEVDAIHPGYGFLSENPALARACAKAGLAFVGPTPELLELLGDKTAARRLAAAAGVSVLPGTENAVSSPEEAQKIAAEIGFPVIVKAAMGGGGRGMRVVHDPAQLAARLEEAQGEAKSAFGDASVFLEKFLPRARHIEVQILADEHGNLLHLYERDCSVQRRHQKVVEVAPALNLPDRVRAEICDAAVKIARQAKYRNAGTVEFLYDVDAQKWYFIEVNPRIQVEHTVTEMVTGIDIVRAQILVAQGHELHEAPLSLPMQEKVPLYGAALQCRVTTEDPEKNFRAGLWTHLHLSLARRFRHSSRWRHRVRRRGARRVLRFAAGESHRLGHESPRSLPAHGSRVARIPHPRRENEHPVPRKRGESSAFPRQRSHHFLFGRFAGTFPLHRAAPTAPPSCSRISAT